MKLDIWEKLRLRRRDQDWAEDQDRKDAGRLDAQRREDEERRVAAAEAADIEASIAREEAEDRAREAALEEEERRPLQAERPVPDEAVRPYIHDPEMDPGWLDRWEAEGTMAPLTDAERAKLEAIDREDPIGREGRAQFLPREVLAIRANSDRWAAEREQAKASALDAAQEPERQEQERKSAVAVEREREQEPDDEMEMDR
jgi:hypothetical protein